MTKTDPVLAIVQRQRRFEWELARDEQTRAAAKMVAGKTHDLLNLIQIVELASYELERRCDATGKEFVADLVRAAGDAKTSLMAMMEVARPDHAKVKGPPVGAAVTRAVDALRPSVPLALHLAIAPDTCSELTEAQLEALVTGVALDALSASRIELFVRDRQIGERAWIEIVRGADIEATEELGFDLRAVEAIAKKGGGELASSDRRGGGTELVVAVPAIA